MTVVVAVKSGKYLQPSGRQLQFEPGIVMAGDTRLSYVNAVNLSPEDDHVKVDSIGTYAVAGYAGNSNIAESVLTKLEEAIAQTDDFRTRSIAELTKKMFFDEYNRLGSSQKNFRVQILLGIRDSKTKKFVLYKMDSKNNFELQSRDGMAVIGTHGKYVRGMFEAIRREALIFPNDPFKGPKVKLKENLTQLIWFLLDKAIETASVTEGPKSYIGGQPHLIVLSSRGVEAMNPDENKRLRL